VRRANAIDRVWIIGSILAGIGLASILENSESDRDFQTRRK
jgi:hypothetical protein